MDQLQCGLPCAIIQSALHILRHLKPKKEAVERWNSRPAEEALQKSIAELEAERDHFREVAEKLVWLYSDEHQERLDNGLRIDGFYSHKWLGMILDMAREAMKGAGK